MSWLAMRTGNCLTLKPAQAPKKSAIHQIHQPLRHLLYVTSCFSLLACAQRVGFYRQRQSLHGRNSSAAVAVTARIPQRTCTMFRIESVIWACKVFTIHKHLYNRWNLKKREQLEKKTKTTPLSKITPSFHLSLCCMYGEQVLVKSNIIITIVILIGNSLFIHLNFHCLYVMYSTILSCLSVSSFLSFFVPFELHFQVSCLSLLQSFF